MDAWKRLHFRVFGPPERQASIREKLQEKLQLEKQQHKRKLEQDFALKKKLKLLYPKTSEGDSDVVLEDLD